MTSKDVFLSYELAGWERLMRENGLKVYRANRIKQTELTPVSGYLNCSS